jgi:hypothetical protein
MNVRSRPTKKMLLELTGGNQTLIGSAHHGLFETSLKEIYPYLDLDEAIAFAASSWQSRDRDIKGFRKTLDNVGLFEGIYDVFGDVFKIGMPWVKKHKNIPEEMKEKHKKLNPYGGKDLRDRLEAVENGAIPRLVDKLREETNTYVFECNYMEEKMARGGTNYKLEPMHFQNAYPKKGVNTVNYAAEVARMIKRYPAVYDGER